MNFSRNLFRCLLFFSFFLIYTVGNASSSTTKSSSPPTCTGITITGGAGKITVVGYGSGLSQIIVLDQSDYSQAYQCAYNCPNNFNEISLPAGTYFVKVVKYDSGYNEECTYQEYNIAVTSGSSCPNIAVNPGPGQLTVIGYTQSSPTSHVKVFNSSWGLEDECWGTGCPSGAFTVNGLAAGNYYVVVDYYNPSTCSSYFGTHSVSSSARVADNNTGYGASPTKIPQHSKSNSSFKQAVEFSRVMPNPATDFLTVQLHSSTELNTPLRIFNLQGKLVMEQPLQLTTGFNQVELTISDLPKGMYFLMPINGAAPSSRTKFLKQ
ncbi:MAG: T9SS type A sorting domain-containing protein [Bacteroidota bacterium]